MINASTVTVLPVLLIFHSTYLTRTVPFTRPSSSLTPVQFAAATMLVLLLLIAIIITVAIAVWTVYHTLPAYPLYRQFRTHLYHHFPYTGATVTDHRGELEGEVVSIVRGTVLVESRTEWEGRRMVRRDWVSLKLVTWQAGRGQTGRGQEGRGRENGQQNGQGSKEVDSREDSVDSTILYVVPDPEPAQNVVPDDESRGE